MEILELYDLIQYFSRVFKHLKIDFFLTGSVAASFYGKPRSTNDVDVVADIHEHHVAGLLEQFPAPGFYLSEQALREALAHRSQFNILHPGTGLKIDVMIPQDNAFNASRFQRRRESVPVAEGMTFLASGEDVILMKMKYYQEGGSDKHLADIEGIFAVSGQNLDLDYLEVWAERLGLQETWSRIRKTLGL